MRGRRLRERRRRCYPDSSNPQAGGYGKLDAQHAALAGYTGAQEMVTAIMAAQTTQLEAMANFLNNSNLDGALQCAQALGA